MGLIWKDQESVLVESRYESRAKGGVGRENRLREVYVGNDSSEGEAWEGV